MRIAAPLLAAILALGAGCGGGPDTAPEGVPGQAPVLSLARVRPGMAVEEVESLVGVPPQKEALAAEDGSLEIWYYAGGALIVRDAHVQEVYAGRAPGN